MCCSAFRWTLVLYIDYLNAAALCVFHGVFIEGLTVLFIAFAIYFCEISEFGMEKA